MTSSALIFPDGRRNELDRDVAVGRAPVAPPSSPTAALVSLSVPTVSKTHALFGQSADGPWVVDLGSSNGTEVLGPSGGARRIEAGQRTSIPDGHTIRLGPDTVVVIETGTAAPAVDDATVSHRPAPAGPAAATPVPGNSAPGAPGVFYAPHEASPPASQPGGSPLGGPA